MNKFAYELGWIAKRAYDSTTPVSDMSLEEANKAVQSLGSNEIGTNGLRWVGNRYSSDYMHRSGNIPYMTKYKNESGPFRGKLRREEQLWTNIMSTLKLLEVDPQELVHFLHLRIGGK